MQIVKGINPVIEILKEKKQIEKLEVYKGINKKTISKILELASKQNVKIFYTDKRYENSQGVVAHISDYDYYKEFESLLEKVVVKEKSFVLILDQLQDPRNFGAIIRTAECFGVDGIIIQDRNNVKVTETVVKTSTGAIEHVDIVQVVNISNAIEKLQKYGFTVYGAEANGDTYYKSEEFPNKVALVIGSEGKGMRNKVREHCDKILNIHLKGKINSLNASVAASILMAEISSKF